jgi:cobalt-zinc-cadmium efflux system protein
VRPVSAPPRQSEESTGNLRVAFFLNAAFTLIEIAGGLWTNSVAILADALHDGGDSLSLGVAWYFDRVSRRSATPRDTYGARRYSLVGGLVTALVLLVGLAFVLWQGVARLRAPEPVNAPGMMILAVVGIVFNGIAVLRVRRGTSLTESIVGWHLLEDALGWVAVLLGAGAMALWDVPVLDPLLSIGIALWVLWNVVRRLRKVFAVFLQKVPASFDHDRLEQQLAAMPEVRGQHHAHVWSIDGEKHVFTTHLVMRATATRGDIVAAKRRVRELLDAEQFEHVTIDVELEGEDCASVPPSEGGE